MLPRYVIYVAVVLLGIAVCGAAAKRHRSASTRIGRSGRLRLVKDASELRFMPLRVEFEKDKGSAATSPSSSSTGGGKGDGKVTLQLSASKETTKRKQSSSSATPSPAATTARPSLQLPTLTQLIQTILQLSQLQDSLRPASTLTTSTASSPPSSVTSDSAPSSSAPPPPQAAAPSTTTTTTTTTTTLSPRIYCNFMPYLQECLRHAAFQQPPQQTFFENIGAAAAGHRNPYMVFVVPKMARDAQTRYDKEHNFARPRKLDKIIGKQKHRFWKKN